MKWKCLDHACPDRAPVESDDALTCYTCGESMTHVVEMNARSESTEPSPKADLVMAETAIERVRQAAKPFRFTRGWW